VIRTSPDPIRDFALQHPVATEAILIVAGVLLALYIYKRLGG